MMQDAKRLIDVGFNLESNMEVCNSSAATTINSEQIQLVVPYLP